MGVNSGIQWTDDTLNAIVGCSWRSPACDNCYARYDVNRMARNPRLEEQLDGLVDGSSGELKWTGRVQFFPERLDAVLRVHRGRRYFTNSLSDLFHENLDEDVIQKHFKTFREAHQHTFQILTKRSQRLRELSPNIDWPCNVWMGVTVEDVRRLDRIPDLAATQARIKWVSFEPWLSDPATPLCEAVPNLRNRLEGIDWAVIGGESSKTKYGARPMLFEDVRYLIGECRAAGAKVFLKQLGTLWAIASGTNDAMGDDGKPVKKAKSGGEPSLWPAEFQSPSLREFPDVRVMESFAASEAIDNSVGPDKASKSDPPDGCPAPDQSAADSDHSDLSCSPSVHKPAAAKDMTHPAPTSRPTTHKSKSRSQRRWNRQRKNTYWIFEE